MFSSIANMIIKASDNMNRGAENASKAGKGSNGQNYQITSEDSETTASSGGGAPSGSDSNAAQDFADKAKGATQNIASAISNIGGDDNNNNMSNTGSSEEDTKGINPMGFTSDERLKNIFGDNEDIIKTFAKIDAIQFTYNDKAKQIHPGNENGVDGDLHLGIKAQDLEKNPLTASAVSEDSSGFKQVDPAELTMAKSAVISEICKRIEIIEKVLGIKVV